ncbi:MAG: hypothetical protein ACOC95_00665 [Planctomycetota bacterium]
MYDTDGNDGFSMDSFLDIVTNVVGLMILLALIVVLAFGQFHLELGTPLLHPAEGDVEPLWIECRGNALYDLDLDNEMKEAGEIWIKHLLDDDNDDAVRSAVKRADLRNQHYRVVFRKTDLTVRDGQIVPFPSFEIVPLDGAPSFPIDQLSMPDGGFHRKLNTVDSQDRFVYFAVRPDSFEAFRTARKIARGRGYRVGWMPLSAEGNLTTGAGGGDGPGWQDTSG